MQIQDVNSNSSWITTQEGEQHYLLRWVSPEEIPAIEKFTQRLQICKHRLIAIPELVRYPNGEVYLKERRERKTFAQFLSFSPSTRAKLYFIRQLSHALENLHTFVGIPHGSLSPDCISISNTGDILLGGLNYSNGDISTDTDQLHDVISQLMITESEQAVAMGVLGQPPFRVRDEFNKMLIQDDWGEVLADWQQAITTPLPEVDSEDIDELAEQRLNEQTSALRANTAPAPVESDPITTEYDDDLFTEEAIELPKPNNLRPPRSEESAEEDEFLSALFDVDSPQDTQETHLSDQSLEETMLDIDGASEVDIDEITLTIPQATLQSAVELDELNDWENEDTVNNIADTPPEPLPEEEPSAEGYSLEEVKPDLSAFFDEETHDFYTIEDEDGPKKTFVAVAALATLLGSGVAYAIYQSVSAPLPEEATTTDIQNNKNEFVPPAPLPTAEEQSTTSAAATEPEDKTAISEAVEPSPQVSSSLPKPIKDLAPLPQSSQTKSVTKPLTAAPKTPPKNKTEIRTTSKRSTAQPTQPKTVATLEVAPTVSNKKSTSSPSTTTSDSTKKQTKKTDPNTATNTKTSPQTAQAPSVFSQALPDNITIAPIDKESDTADKSSNTSVVPADEETMASSPQKDLQKETPAVKKTNTTNLDHFARLALQGNLQPVHLSRLQTLPASDANYTRAQAILLMHAQQSTDTQLIVTSLDNLLSVAANERNPAFLLAKAHQLFNAQQYDQALQYLLEAERHWEAVPASQKRALSTQKTLIHAHLRYIDFLETGNEASQKSARKMFQKVLRMAKKAKLKTAETIASAKITRLDSQ